jgi:flagellar motility protein MotE (MotC chaperone)
MSTHKKNILKLTEALKQLENKTKTKQKTKDENNSGTSGCDRA